MSYLSDATARLHPHPKTPPVPVGPPARALIVVRLVNRSQHVSDAQVAAAAIDLQTQVSHDFAPTWFIDAAIAAGGEAQPGEWPLFVEDDSTVTGALGYHEEVAGTPTGHVFAKTSADHGVEWAGVASHELLEMLGDPRTVLGAIVDPVGDGKAGRFVMAEACDAVEQSTYTVGRTKVSNFVLPSWWDLAASGPYDHLGLLKAPLELLPGGSYIGEIVFSSTNGWETPTARTVPTP